MPNIKKVADQYANDGVVVLLVSVDDKAATVEKFVKSKPLPGTVVHTEGGMKGDLAKLYNVSSTPATFLVGRNGTVAATDLHGKKLKSEVAKAVRETVPAVGSSD